MTSESAIVYMEYFDSLFFSLRSLMLFKGLLKGFFYSSGLIGTFHGLCGGGGFVVVL